MERDPVDRRRVLTLGAATALGVWTGFASATPTAEGQPEKEEKPQGEWTVAVDIPGCPDASKSISAIAIDGMTVDVRGAPDRRVFGPGDAHFGSITIRCRTLGGSKELQTWFMSASKGKNIRKNITVTLFKSDKSPGRSYSFLDCFPTQWSSVNFDTSSTVQTETIVCKMGRVELA